MLSVRLPETLEHNLQRHCTTHQRTRTQVVQDALTEYLFKTEETVSPSEPDLSFLAPDDPIREFIGSAKGGPSTDEWMAITRGEDWNRP